MNHMLVEILYALVLLTYLWSLGKVFRAWKLGLKGRLLKFTAASCVVFIAIEVHWYLTAKSSGGELTEILWLLWETLIGYSLGAWVVNYSYIRPCQEDFNSSQYRRVP